jgi:Polysaccharide deacetylase
MNGECLRCFVFHAERLESDQVWERTLRVLDLLESSRGRATMFVHPYRAIQMGFDLESRIKELLARGHEVAQHTHFYDLKDPGDLSKPLGDTSPENVRRCLDRDRNDLIRCGADPRGFTAGQWLIDDAATAWLAENRFRYDCSYRSFDLRYENPAVARGGVIRPILADSVVRLPTTVTLRDAAAGLLPRESVVNLDDLRYKLVYAHDYDLVLPMRAFASRRVIKTWSHRPGRWVTASEVAELVRARLDRPA